MEPQANRQWLTGAPNPDGVGTKKPSEKSYVFTGLSRGFSDGGVVMSRGGIGTGG
jgi:hypothetical protein